MRLFFCLCAAQGEVKGLHFGELRVRLTFSPHFPRLICVVAHRVWNARACLADLTVFCNSSCTGAYENCHPPELSLLQNRFQALQFYGFSVIRKNREALVGIRCVTTKTAQVFIKCCKFLWLRHIYYIWHVQVCRGKPRKFSKEGIGQESNGAANQEKQIFLLCQISRFVPKRSGKEISPTQISLRAVVNIEITGRLFKQSLC